MINSERDESKEDVEDPPISNIIRPIYCGRSEEILIEWLKCHLEHPYPNYRQRVQLCELTGLTRKSLKDWFITKAKVIEKVHFFRRKSKIYV